MNLDEIDLERFWNHYQKFVFKICHRYAFNDDDMDELTQEGFIALCAAAETFDPEQGSFLNHAYFYIRKVCYRYINNNRTVRVPEWARPAVNKYKGTRPLPTLTRLKIDFNYTSKQAETALYAIQAAGQVESLDAPVTDDESVTLADMIGNDKYSPEHVLDDIENEERRAAVKESLRTLEPIERRVLCFRFYEGKTRAEIAEPLHITPQQVEKIEKRAYKKLRTSENRIRLEPFRDGIIRNKGVQRTGLSAFRRSWTSATEREALDLIERGERYFR